MPNRPEVLMVTLPPRTFTELARMSLFSLGMATSEAVLILILPALPVLLKLELELTLLIVKVPTPISSTDSVALIVTSPALPVPAYFLCHCAIPERLFYSFLWAKMLIICSKILPILQNYLSL